MVAYKGFKTKKEAQAFARQTKNGTVCWEEYTPKRRLLTARGRDYEFYVKACGLDKEKYPYCVQWRV